QMNRRGVAAVAIAAWLSAAPAESRTFRQIFRGQGRVPSPTIALGNALADTVARSLPVTSASPGLTFSYDPASGAYVRDTDLLGQLYLERARPIGKGKWNVTASYQRVQIDAVQGIDLDGLSDTSLPIVTNTFNSAGKRGSSLVKFDKYDVSLAVNMVTLAATYGLTDNIDVNLTLPILASRLSVDSRQRMFTFNPTTEELVPAGFNAFDEALT